MYTFSDVLPEINLLIKHYILRYPCVWVSRCANTQCLWTLNIISRVWNLQYIRTAVAKQRYRLACCQQPGERTVTSNYIIFVSLDSNQIRVNFRTSLWKSIIQRRKKLHYATCFPITIIFFFTCVNFICPSL